MKSTFLSLAAAFLFLYQSASKAIDGQIKQVVLYQQGAKISGASQVNLSEGTNEIVLENLSPFVDPNSIQVSLKGKCTLLSVSFRTNFLGEVRLPLRTREIKDSLTQVTDQIDWLKNEIAISQGEEKLIIDNQRIVNEKEKITATDLTLLADFYRTRLTAIRKKVYNANIEIRDLNELKLALEKQLRELEYDKGKQTGEIVLTITSELSSKVAIEYSYLSREAGWSPLYDIRCDVVDKPLNLVHKANVYQHTGFDWKDVDLTISTANPSADNNRPIMSPWYIDFLQPIYRSASSGSMQKSVREAAPMSNMMTMEDAVEISESKEEEYSAPVPYEVEASTGQMAMEYAIKIKQDIPSDGKEHIVPISELELPATYSYHSVPKLDRHTFLLARVPDFNQFNLLPGQSNIFFEGMYVGQTYLNPDITSDTLLISMGRDDRISITRNVLKDISSKQLIGANKKEVKGYEIVVKNNKNIKVTVEILDQLPISKNKELIVEAEELSGANYTPDYGKLVWKLDLAAGESKKLKLIYSVKYPNDKLIENL